MEQRRRGCRNSQAKGPVSDGTLESHEAPKKQSINRRIFQVSDRGISDMESVCVYLCFLLPKQGTDNNYKLTGGDG